MAILFVFSIGRVFRLVRLIPIPLLAGERASIRMIIFPVVTLLILAAIEFQAWLRERDFSPILQVSILGGIFLIGHDLWQHLKVWQVTNAVSAFDVARVDLTLESGRQPSRPGIHHHAGDRGGRLGPYPGSIDHPVGARKTRRQRIERRKNGHI